MSNQKRNLFIILCSLFCGIFLCKSSVSAATDKAIMKQVQQMSLQDRIAQMYFTPSSGDNNQMCSDIKKYHLGGVVLFGSDFQNQTPAQFKNKMKQLQQASSIPLFIGTDQEGGTVSRLNDNPQLTNNRQFPAPMKLNQNMQQEVNEAKQTAAILHNLGINWNFAPVADVSNDPNSFIYPRTFGKNYQQTADYIKKVIPTIQSQHVAATLKHFPGYGTAGDTHTGFASTNKSITDFKKEDFLPFKAGIQAHADAVLVSHIIINQIDSQYPASLSPKVINVLRHNLHYSGVIITDDLGMDAITKFAQKKQINADVQAVKAGNDILLSKNYATGIPAIEKAVKQHQISEKQINNSVYRILVLKKKLGLLK